MSVQDLTLEKEIIWKYNPKDIDYVHEEWVFRKSKSHGIHLGCQKVVIGYSVLKDSVPFQPCYDRRVFYLYPWDRFFSPLGDYRYGVPGGVYDPLTIAPGVMGKSTERCNRMNQLQKDIDLAKAENRFDEFADSVLNRR